jgi:DNA-binding PadR family transcriptional regulator
MGKTRRGAARGRSRGLRGATLALIAERGGHGYELAHRLNVRLGPTWRVGPKQIYPILDELVRAGLATSAEEPNPDRPRQPRIVYRATDRAPEVLRLWMQSPVEKEPARPDLLARIASATPADVVELTEALDEYERDLQRLLADNEAANVSVSSWNTLLFSVVRGHTDAQLQGELRWLDEARRRIAEFGSSRPSGPA